MDGGQLIYWRRHPDLNRGIKLLQSSALPLGYVAVTACSPENGHKMERITGLEPATSTLARSRSTK